MGKRNITERTDVRWSVEGELKKVISFLQKAQNDGWERINIDYDRGYYDSVDIRVELTKIRLETDAEYEARVAQEESYRARTEYQERELLAKLQQKYGTTT